MSKFHFKESKFLQKSISIIFATVSCIILCFPMTGYTCYAQESEEKTAVFSQNIYHKHTGNDNGGGCYTDKKTKTEKKEEPCGGHLVYFPAQDESKCDRCAAGYSGDEGGRECWHSTTKTVTKTYYDLGCGKGSNTLLGTLTVTQSTTDWVKSLTLTGSYETQGDMVVDELPYIWNGGSASGNDTYEVTASGSYSLTLNADENATEATVRVDVRNVDVTAPVIRAHTQDPAEGWTNEGVLVTITDAVDLQPDGSEGCGLHEFPYSYDNGETWTAETTHTYLENGAHSVLVRDKLENTSSYQVEFYNVDCTPPTIQAVEYDHTKNVISVVIEITAKDLQPDGSEGSGLHETPYSYDGGKTWTAENTLPVDKNGTISIAVRDSLENITHIDEVVTNIDCTGPTLHYKMEDDSWTNQDVTLYLSAEDVNEDGSAGIGLADAWYSLDGGKHWSDKPKRVYEENTKLTIIVRDKNGNQATQKIKIKQIDKELPWVTIGMEIIGEGADMQVKLQAYAGDDYSGLHDEAYSWNKGASYSAQSSIIVTENGTYQATVRDKAGNVRYELIEVNVFPAFLPVLPPVAEKPAAVEVTEPMEAETETETEEETETETAVVEVTMEELVEEPEEIGTKTLEKEGLSLGEFLLILGLLLLLGALIALLFLLWFRTVAVYAENSGGSMEYICRKWIHSREDRYEVEIPASVVEQCVTTHFQFRPGILFVKLHEKEEMYFLFPDDVCETLPVEQKMDVSLL